MTNVLGRSSQIVRHRTHGDVLQGYFRMERSGRAMAGREGASFTVQLEPGIAQFSTGRASLPGMMPVSDRLGRRWTGAAIPGAPVRTGGWPPPGQTRTDMISRALRPDLLPTRSPGLAAQLRSGEPRTGVSRRGGGAAGLATAQARLDTQVRATQLSPGQVRIIGPGRALPDDVRRPLERFFDADFSPVRVHEGLAAGPIGAMAFTLGEAICFAPGRYDPRSRDGLRLLGHELAHVVQQRQGRVTNPFGGGIAIVQDPSLEAEADRVGNDVAERFGSTVQAKPLTRTTRAGRCMQLMEDQPKEKTIVGERVTVRSMKSTGYIIEEFKGTGYKVRFSEEDKEGAFYLKGNVEFVNLGISSLKFVNELPKGPYLRVNSFAFAMSKNHPIGSDGFGGCLGVVIHDRRQRAGVLAHIDTDDLVALEAKSTRIFESITAMLISLDPLYYADLEVIFFAGSGLMRMTEDRYAPFKQLVASNLSKIGLAVEQVSYRFEVEPTKRVTMAVYAPLTGELYLHPGWASLDREKDCFARIAYDKKTDYEDQEEVKERVENGEIFIVEVMFNGDGEEILYCEKYRGGLLSGGWVGEGKGSIASNLVFP